MNMNAGNRTNRITEAADWYARLRSPTLSEVDAARFRAWLSSHPDNRREYEELDVFWDELAVLEETPEVRREIAARAAEKTAVAAPRPWKSLFVPGAKG